MAERNPPKLLLVEDDLGLQRQLAWAFDDFEVFRASDRASAEAVLSRERPSVVLLDLGLPPDADGPSEGLATLQSVLRGSPERKVLMMSGQNARDFALQAMAPVAHDFNKKPIELDGLPHSVERTPRTPNPGQDTRQLRTPAT